MTEPVTLEQVEALAVQLTPQEQLKLVAHVSERLSDALSVAPVEENREASEQAKCLQLARELLAEVEDIEDDSQGEHDAAETIRRMRDERIAQICRSGV